nr:dihydropteroate synthase [Pleurocapsa sp. FMAR1]
MYSSSCPAISVESELERVIPVIEQLRQESTIPISIDTTKATVAQSDRSRGRYSQ